jgi:hypothetical protein
MYIEQIAQERDQIYWACSAQSSDLLPNSKRASLNKGPDALRAAVHNFHSPRQ